MQHTIYCPYCKSVKVKLHNPEAISEFAYPEEPYKFDEEITSSAKCTECDTTFKVIGIIHWVQPQIKKQENTRR